MAYNPKPIDTTDIEFTKELQDVMEEISRNNHEVWSLGRMSSGWRYGETINMDLKTHPSLIPYEQLSESEKDVDRNTSIQVIKALIKLGFKIERSE